mgnify:CR=1 FL=1
MIFIYAILLGLIPASIAYKKGYPSKNEGYNFFVWWIFGASLFIVALPWAILLKSKKRELETSRASEGMKKCPECAELVKKEARICRFCGYEFYPKPKTIDQEIEELDRQKKEVNEKLKEHEDDLNEEII